MVASVLTLDVCSACLDKARQGAELLDEVRTLNEALKANSDAFYTVVDENAALKAEFAAYKSQPFVPRRAFDDVMEARDAALATVDALTRQLQDERDSRSNVTSAAAVRHLIAVIDTLAKESGDVSVERVRNEARSWLAERGHRSREVEVMRAHSEEWLKGKGQR